jgi:Tfp pilus tip-associated adhesin PilY1
MKNKKKLVLFLAISALIVLGLQAWDDEKLFTTIKGGKGKSNVILVQDHTGSTAEVIYHPDFNPNISLSAYTGTLPSTLTRTSWYLRWYTATDKKINTNNIYAQVHSFTSPNTVVVYSEGINIKVGDWVLQYDPASTAEEFNIANQAFGQVTAKSAPDANKRFTLTLADDTTTYNTHNFVAGRRLYVWASTAAILDYTAGTKVLRVSADLRTNFAVNDYIMLFDKDNVYLTDRQVTARITNISYASSRTSLTLADIVGTMNVSSTGQDTVYYRKPAVTKLACLYGSSLPMDNNSVIYIMNPNYLKWIFGVASDAQRQQVSDFHTLAHHVDYNGYLAATPVSPVNARALHLNNSNHVETLLSEWNRVMKAIYPNKIAMLKTDITAAGLTITYEKFKDTFPGYTGGFKIKIDAETMLVSSNVLDSEGKFGTLTIDTSGRGYDNTNAVAHSSGAAIMIYNDIGLGIDESKPLIHLFSSMQNVDEPTGEVDPSWTETKWIDMDRDGNVDSGETKTCWRYKRVFTRVQVAREALCDVITARNKMLAGADLTPAVDHDDTTLTYCNASADFATKAAPFYIMVSDPDVPMSDEVMWVETHVPAENKLTVSRGQRGTSACAHANYAKIKTYSGARDLVRFGVFKFSTVDSLANMKMVDLNDFGQKNADGTYKSTSHINTAILDKVNALTPSGGTPLANVLALVWNYLKPNPGSGTGNYIMNTAASDWKAVDSSTFGTAEKFETIDGVTRPKGSPMEYWCQENYVVLITDGRAENDNDITNTNYGIFNKAWQRSSDAASIVSDFFKFDYNRSSNPTPWGDADSLKDPTGSGSSGLYCLLGTCWAGSGTDYLDDVAFFLYHQDMFPTMKIKTGTYDTTTKIFTSGSPEADPTLYNEKDTNPYKQWPGNQNIKINTVGLCIQNDMLIEAAKNGGGQSYTVSNYQDLSEAFLSIITSVVLAQDPMSYTTYAAPKQSITGGKYGYIAHFVPRERAMWEGHLRRYRLGDDGSFPANIDNPDDTVIIGGTAVKSFKWDAGVILNNRTTARVVYTSKPSSGSWPRLDFMGSAITYTDLDVTTSTQATQVKNFVQNFNRTDGINANSDYNNLYRLGETFHFNPQLVGYPLYWKAQFDASYKSFYDYFSSGSTARTEVVYTGANDGKLHCFDAETGIELWSYVPNSLLKQLKEPALSPLVTTAHTYFVDGKSLVKDIKVAKSDGTFYNDYRDWKTGLFFGLGIGGRAYCALDITTPTDLKVLWELNDSAETVADGRMGFTEAKPIVVDMYAGSTLGKFPAAIVPGGYNSAEVQATDMSAQEWQRREGKALYILNADSGDLIKKFVYGSSASNTAVLNVNPGFLTAMTAAPAVLDKNNDGFADVIYMAESGDHQLANTHGGAIWKINCFGEPSTWQAQKIYQAPAGQTIFVSPSLAYDKDYRVWVMFGTGRRSRPAEGLGTAFTNLAGQFVAFIDDDSGTTITNTNLHDAATAIATSADTDFIIDNEGTIKKGFYFNFIMANEIMWEPQPLYINNRVIFMTFTPREGTGSSGSTDDPCGGTSAVNGSHYIYQFKLTAQGNTFTIGDFLNQSGKILGYGPMDDKFTIYIGAGDAGNFKSIEGDRETVDLKDNYRALLWKEDKK